MSAGEWGIKVQHYNNARLDRLQSEFHFGLPPMTKEQAYTFRSKMLDLPYRVTHVVPYDTLKNLEIL